jgi:hypothetical protein
MGRGAVGEIPVRPRFAPGGAVGRAQWPVRPWVGGPVVATGPGAVEVVDHVVWVVAGAPGVGTTVRVVTATVSPGAGCEVRVVAVGGGALAWVVLAGGGAAAVDEAVVGAEVAVGVAIVDSAVGVVLEIVAVAVATASVVRVGPRRRRVTV